MLPKMPNSFATSPSRAADISLEPGEWFIREGEEPRFFVILDGELEADQRHRWPESEGRAQWRRVLPG
jgi:hypothetical protein